MPLNGLEAKKMFRTVIETNINHRMQCIWLQEKKKKKNSPLQIRHYCDSKQPNKVQLVQVTVGGVDDNLRVALSDQSALR